MKKTFIAIIFIFLFMVIKTSSVQAASAPNKITVKRAIALNDIVENHDHGFVIFTTSDGQVIYCLDIDKEALKSGQTATLVGDADPGLLYILRNAYPSKKLSGISTVDMYTTQAAIWWYASEDKLSDSFKNATKTDVYSIIPKYIKPLVSAAHGAKDNQVKPTITLSNSETSFSLSKNKKYYETGYIAAALTGAQTYTVEVNNPTKNTEIIDESGNVGNTMNNSEKFKIRIPVNEVTKARTVNANVKTVGTQQKAKIYKTNDAKYQRVIGLFDEKVDVMKSLAFSINPIKKACVCEGDTCYGKTGTVIDKEQYKQDCLHICEIYDNSYYGKNGNIVDKETYMSECKNSCEYKNGKYYGKSGEVVDKKTYLKECQHKCEYIDGTYYGKNGNAVDKDTYDNECSGQEVVVPNTGANIIFWSVGLGILAILSGMGFIIYQGDKKNKKKAN